jgi:hypothetical protein
MFSHGRTSKNDSVRIRSVGESETASRANLKKPKFSRQNYIDILDKRKIDVLLNVSKRDVLRDVNSAIFPNPPPAVHLRDDR